MTQQEVDQALFRIVEDPKRYMTKLRKRDFVSVVYSGIKLLRLKTLESWARGISARHSFAADEEQQVLSDPRLFAKDHVPNKGERHLMPSFIERFEKNCLGLGRLHLMIKVKYYAAQNGVFVSNTANVRNKLRYLRFQCKQQCAEGPEEEEDHGDESG